MASSAKVNPSGGSVNWAISISHLKVAVYRALLFDTSNNCIEQWNNQRTDDSVPDTFALKTKPKDLPGCVLHWEAIVMDPSDTGGPYVCTVAIIQDGKILCQDAVSSSIDQGSGQMDFIADQVTFA